MGSGIGYKCKRCGYEASVSEGVGMMYPLFIEELKEEALQGIYGKKIQQIIKEYPDGKINGEKNLYFCPECGSWKAEPKLAYYISKSGETDFFESEDTIRLLTYRHRCDKCNHIMRIVRLIDEPKLTCPECGEVMDEISYYKWD